MDCAICGNLRTPTEVCRFCGDPAEVRVPSYRAPIGTSLGVPLLNALQTSRRAIQRNIPPERPLKRGARIRDPYGQYWEVWVIHQDTVEVRRGSRLWATMRRDYVERQLAEFDIPVKPLLRRTPMRRVIDPETGALYRSRRVPKVIEGQPAPEQRLIQFPGGTRDFVPVVPRAPGRVRTPKKPRVIVKKSVQPVAPSKGKKRR